MKRMDGVGRLLKSGLQQWLLLAALAIVLLGSSRHAQAGAQGEPPDAGHFIEQNLGLTVRPLSLDQLCARLHAAVKTSRDTPNLQIPGQTDRVVTATATGVEVEAYVIEGSPVLINRIKVTSGGPALPPPLRIGSSTPDGVYAALGPDHEATTGPDGAFAQRYFNFEHTASVLLWFDKRERLAGVEWRFDGD